MSLVLVTREGCHVCVEALTLLRQLGYEPELADVDSDDRLHDLYDWRVPVILLDGTVIGEGRIDQPALERALAERLP
jgi:glutaredoxin